MQFSAYQIESMLENYHHDNSPSDRSASENLSLSEEAMYEARQHFTPSENRPLKLNSTKEIVELIEDKTDYDPLVDFVQQSRAGRFVEPVYVPENSPPSFHLVSDYSQHDLKVSEVEQVDHESETDKKDHSHTKLRRENTLVKDKVSLYEAKNEKNLSHSDQINFSNIEKDLGSDSLKINEKDIVIVADKENISEKSGDNKNDLTKSKKKMPTDSAAKLFEKIEEHELDEEFEFDENGLHEGDDTYNDVVFGDGKIDSNSITNFVKSFPDSAIKFIFRKNLDGKNLPVEYEEIYINWEQRGLSRLRLKKYLFKLMKWDNFPDIPVMEVVKRIKDRQYYLKGKK